MPRTACTALRLEGDPLHGDPAATPAWSKTTARDRYGFLRTALITDEPTGGRFTIAVSSLIMPLRIA
jgi:hypothetical protein